MITYIQADITTTEYSIAHGVNCQNVMGSGVAKVLFNKWPEVKDSYHSLFERKSANNPELLGYVQEVLTDDKTIYNCFTQLTYGYNGEKRVNYAAIAIVFKEIAARGVKDIEIPKIGCGLAGGDWDIVEQIITDVIEINPMNVHVYYL